MRQYGEVPPWLSAAAAPQVSATTGLGTGGGAGVQTQDAQGFGSVFVQVGSNPSGSGSITLVFATTPPTMFFSWDSDVTLSVSGQGTTSITLSWASTLQAGRKNVISYEWSVSK